VTAENTQGLIVFYPILLLHIVLLPLVVVQHVVNCC